MELINHPASEVIAKMVWSRSEVKCLELNFPTMRDNKLAGIINKSPNAIRIKASRLWIKKNTTYVRKNLKLTKTEEQLVVGGLLGDLSCRKTSTSKYPRLEGGHSQKQKNYLIWKTNLLKRLDCNIRKSKINTYLYQSKSFKSLEKYYNFFYSTGTKTINREILNLLDDFGLLIWYLDDGHYFKRDKNINLYTNGFSYKEQLLIQTWFGEKYEFNPKIYETKDPKNYPEKSWFYLHFNVEDSKKLISLFKKFEVPNCMKYKLGFQNSHSTILDEVKN